jgi:electron transfer flavoprotein alpha subunit
MKTLVFAEQRNGKLKSSSLEALTTATHFTGNSAEVAVVLVGSGIEELAGSLAGYGADTLFLVDGPAFKDFNCIAYAAALEEAIKTFSPSLVLGIASPMGKDLFPRLAARLDAGLLTDVTDLKIEGETVTAQKPMYSGKVFANYAMQNSKIKFVTIRPNVFPARRTGNGAAKVSKLNVTAPNSRLVTKEIRKGKSEKPDLTEAAMIISGGRALASADNFKILNECADVIGATVGASRAAVDSGYASHDMQVGQTGKTVNPNLYIACGISGSIQHMAGMRTSKVIVAINTDTEAPIFGIANYGIVGDLFQVVPLLTKKFKEIV